MVLINHRDIGVISKRGYLIVHHRIGIMVSQGLSRPCGSHCCLWGSHLNNFITCLFWHIFSNLSWLLYWYLIPIVRLPVLPSFAVQPLSIGHFRVPLCLSFEASLNFCHDNKVQFQHEWKLIFMTHDFTLSVALKWRLRWTWKWPILSTLPFSSLTLGCPGSRSSLGPSSSTSSSCLRLLTTNFVNFQLSISCTVAHWTSMNFTVIPIDICWSYCRYSNNVNRSRIYFQISKIMSVETTIRLSRTCRWAHFFPGEEVWQLRTDRSWQSIADKFYPSIGKHGLGHISLVMKIPSSFVRSTSFVWKYHLDTGLSQLIL